MDNDFEVIRKAVTGQDPGQVPLYEHFVDDEIIQEIMGCDFSEMRSESCATITTFRVGLVPEAALEDNVALWKHRLTFYRQMGYRYLPVEFPPVFPQTSKIKAKDTAQHGRGDREWINEHDGVIKTVEDLENPDYWPDLDKMFDYRLFDRITRILPEGMKIVGGFAGGPMEHALYLMGFEQFCLALHENQELLNKLFEKLRTLFVSIARRLSQFDALGIMRIGDDLGYKNGTIISPQALRKYIFPIYKDLVDISHQAGRPFILHSCGNLKTVMEDLIEDCRFDAKHSFEDVIMPVTEVKKRWGDRIALLGGIDVDFLCRRSEREIQETTRRVMEVCSQGGGYAIGSGNSIPNYMPVKNYLAMLDAAREFS